MCTVTKTDPAVSCRDLWAGAVRKNIQKNPRLELHISPSSLLALYLDAMAMMKATLTLGDHADLFSLIHPQTMLPARASLTGGPTEAA